MSSARIVRASTGCPADRLGVAAKCGRCKSPLFIGKPLESRCSGFPDPAHAQRYPAAGRLLGTLVRSLQDDGAGIRAGRGTAGTGFTSAQGQYRGAAGDRGQFGIRSIPTMILFAQGTGALQDVGRARRLRYRGLGASASALIAVARAGLLGDWQLASRGPVQRPWGW